MLFTTIPVIVNLVGGLEHDFIFPYIGNVIIPVDELIFFRGVGLNHQPDHQIEDLRGSPINQPGFNGLSSDPVTCQE